MPEQRGPDEVRREIEHEREALVASVETLRASMAQAADVASRLREKLPLLAAGGLGAGFVLAGGIGATARLVVRRGREGHERARLGRYSVVERD